jgi:tetratricopeptide (TPR) repeat protein
MAARAKLDRLSEEVRDIAEQASVIGDEFRVRTLSLMASKPEEEIERLLEEGVRRGVLCERGLSPGEDCRFHHTILRRALYEALSPRRRRRLHFKAAEAIELVYLRDGDRVAGALSAHYHAAGELLKTFNWSLRAWQAAKSRWHWNEAVISIERAHRASLELDRLEQSPIGSIDRLKLSLGMSEGYCTVGRLKESESALEDAISLAESLEDQSSLAAAMLQRGLTQSGLGLHRDAIRSIERALEIHRAIGDQTGIDLALVQLGTVQVAMGDYESAAKLIEQSLAEMPLDSHIAARAFGILGWARVLQGSCAQGVPLLERALDYHDRVGDVRQQAQVLRRLHWAHLTRGRFEAAVRLAERARDHFRTAGDANGEAKMNMSIGQARIGQGLYDQGIELLNRVLATFRSIGDSHCEAESLWLLGRAHLEECRYGEAGLLLNGSLVMVQRIGDRDDQFRVLIDIARLKTRQEDYLGALGAADQAVEIAGELRNREGLGIALIERACACLGLNRPNKSLEAAEQAIALLDETESGERWRAYWGLAVVLDAVGERGGLRSKERALSALRRSVELLNEMREEMDECDATGRAGLTRARSGPARDLHRMLLRLDLKSEAESVSTDWQLDEPITKSGKLRLVRLPKAI